MGTMYCVPSHCMYNHYGSFGPLWKKKKNLFSFFYLILVFVFLIFFNDSSGLQ